MCAVAGLVAGREEIAFRERRYNWFDMGSSRFWIYLPLKEQKVELPKSDKLWEQLGSDDSEAAYQATGKLIKSPGMPKR